MEDFVRLQQEINELKTFFPSELMKMSKMVTDIAMALNVRSDDQDIVGRVRRLVQENDRLTVEKKFLSEKLVQMVGAVNNIYEQKERKNG